MKDIILRALDRPGLLEGVSAEDLKILSGPEEKSFIENDNIGYKVETNKVAHTYFNASKNQGILPTRKDVRRYLNTSESDGDKNYTLLNMFSETTGIQFKDLGNGRYAFSDTKGVLLNGGLNLPLNTTPQQLLDSLGYTKHVRGLVGKIGQEKKLFLNRQH